MSHAEAWSTIWGYWMSRGSKDSQLSSTLFEFLNVRFFCVSACCATNKVPRDRRSFSCLRDQRININSKKLGLAEIFLVQLWGWIVPRSCMTPFATPSPKFRSAAWAPSIFDFLDHKIYCSPLQCTELVLPYWMRWSVVQAWSIISLQLRRSRKSGRLSLIFSRTKKNRLARFLNLSIEPLWPFLGLTS